MIYQCSCGFRGKEPELEDGNCPRCGASLKVKAETESETSRRRRRKSDGG